MIAFSFVFLLKIAAKNPLHLRIDKDGIAQTLDQIANTLRNVTSKSHPSHYLTGIGASMRKLLDRFLPPPQKGPSNADTIMGPPFPIDANTSWLSPSDQFFLGQYDFLYSSGADFNTFDLDLGIPHHQ
jgi:hypothetical protein